MRNNIDRKLIRRHFVIAIILVAIYYTLHYIGQYTSMDAYYTVEWASRNLTVPFMVISLLFIILRKPVIAICGTIGFPVGVIAGDTIGTYLELKDIARFEAELKSGVESINWEPTHQGWSICIQVFILGLIVGYIIDKFKLKRTRNKLYGIIRNL
jgi:hypothetical protein